MSVKMTDNRTTELATIIEALTALASATTWTVPNSTSSVENYELKHHVVYRQAYGEIPEGCNIVFADRDKRNFDPANLVAVPRGIWSTISRKKMAFWDAESLRTCMAAARLDQARRAAECRPRACRRCGCEFEARYPNQRTCDACLGRVGR